MIKREVRMRMKMKKILVASVLAVALLGCGKRERRHIIIMPDVSASIDHESLSQAFKAIDEFVPHLQRGDKLTIIPILGDAQAEASGRILRFEVPSSRQPYDGDLKDFRNRLKVSLTQLQWHVAAHPGEKTDILGSVSLAAQEFQTRDSESNRFLVILSDFVHEDSDLNFRSDSRLRTPASSARLSKEIANQGGLSLRNIHVYLGALRSKEYTRLDKAQRTAIKTFWMEYFDSLGGNAEFATDGTRVLENVN
jgi:hypothetical protein